VRPYAPAPPPARLIAFQFAPSVAAGRAAGYHGGMPRIYTRTGDRGETGLFGGGRVPKSHARVEAYGAVDELNSVIGWAIAVQEDDDIRRKLISIQPDLFTLGAHLATPPAKDRRRRPALPELGPGRVAELERWIDEADAELPELRAFILPGGVQAGAALHVARTVCRRAERRVVALAAIEPVEDDIIVYLNRLSDLLFMLARLANHRAGASEARWEPRTGS
jgi:cob(I)alamin adenosyltransferase